MKALQGICMVFLLTALFTMSPSAQPIDSTITLNSDTPVYSDAGLTSLAGDVPTILALTPGEDREPQIDILPNGSTVVFWVNRNGSHHISGLDAAGNLLAPTFTDDAADDVIVGINTEDNTNWTLCKADPNNNRFLVGATYLADTLTWSDAEIPQSVLDENGGEGDNSQGHGFFRIFDESLNPLTDPISISDFTTGHREWSCCWLNNGRFVIGTVTQGHEYEYDEDYGTGGSNIATINMFNPDGTRYRSEFYIDDLTGEQKNVSLGALQNGFVSIYEDDDSRVGGEDVYRGVIYNDEGTETARFIATDTIVLNGDDDDPDNDETIVIHPTAMAAGGSDRFVTVYELTAPSGIGLPDEIVDMPVVMAQLWNAQGQKIGPYILVSQHNDFRNAERVRCAMAANGTFICSWIDSGADLVTFTDSVIARIFNADGSPATEAFVAHPLPEFEDTYGGDPSESIPAIGLDKSAVAWATTDAPDGQFRDIAMMVFGNPATNVLSWELY